MKFNIAPGIYKELCEQIEKDAGFLQECGIIDYSLLIGIHDRGNPMAIGDKFGQDKGQGSNKYRDTPTNAGSNIHWFDNKNATERELCWGDKLLSPLNTSEGRYLLHFGIIDTLTKYNWKKRIEFFSRRVLQGPGISCVPPDKYAKRFVEFMSNNVFNPKKIDLKYPLTAGEQGGKSYKQAVKKQQTTPQNFTDAAERATRGK